MIIIIVQININGDKFITNILPQYSHDPHLLYLYLKFDL